MACQVNLRGILKYTHTQMCTHKHTLFNMHAMLYIVFVLVVVKLPGGSTTGEGEDEKWSAKS